MAELQNIVEEIKKLTVVEVSDLVKMLEEEFGVSAAAQMAAAPAAGEAAAAEEKSEFTIHLTDVGGSKLAVIKAVKEVTGLGLGEAKALVDSAPSVIKENVPAEDAKVIESKLKDAGASVELK